MKKQTKRTTKWTINFCAIIDSVKWWQFAGSWTCDYLTGSNSPALSGTISTEKTTSNEIWSWQHTVDVNSFVFNEKIVWKLNIAKLCMAVLSRVKQRTLVFSIITYCVNAFQIKSYRRKIQIKINAETRTPNKPTQQQWHRRLTSKYLWYAWYYCCRFCTKPATYFVITSNLAFTIPSYRLIRSFLFRPCCFGRAMSKIYCKYSKDASKCS